MSLPLAIILLLICIISYLLKKYNVLLFLLILSLFSDIFDLNIGVALKLHHFIVLMYVPQLLRYYLKDFFLQKKLRPLVYEYVIVLFGGLIFGFIFPFKDYFEDVRAFAQRSEMRAIISSIRLFLELFTILLVVFWVKTNRIQIEKIIKFISIVLIINVTVAIVDFFSGYVLKLTLCPACIANVGWGHFTGLSGEPRAFGRYCSFGFIFLLFFGSIQYNMLRKIGVITSIIGIVLSMSASSLIITIIGMGIFLIYKRSVKSVVVIFSLLLVGYYSLQTNEYFQGATVNKIKMVLALNADESYDEKVSADEPEIFKRFEIFDRAALNFFFHYPLYSFFGTGPNIISIPASPYLTDSSKAIYEDGINSTPHTLIVNVLSRTGVVGLILYMLFFVRIYRSLKSRDEKYFFISFFFMSFLVLTTLFYFYSGLSIALIKNKNQKNLYA